MFTCDFYGSLLFLTRDHCFDVGKIFDFENSLNYFHNFRYSHQFQLKNK